MTNDQDIRLSCSFFENLKIQKLEASHGAKGPLCLLKLWAYAARHKPDGALNGMNGEDVEIASGWRGERGKFATSLLQLRLLQEYEGGLKINGWEEHQPWIIHAPARKAAASKAAKAKWDKRTMCDADRMRTALPSACAAHAPRIAPSPTPIPIPTPTAVNNGVGKRPPTSRKRKGVTAEDLGFNPVAIWQEEYKLQYRQYATLDGKETGGLMNLGSLAGNPDRFRLFVRAYLENKTPRYVNDGHPVALLQQAKNRFFAEAQPNALFEPEETDDATETDITPDASDAATDTGDDADPPPAGDSGGDTASQSGE